MTTPEDYVPLLNFVGEHDKVREEELFTVPPDTDTTGWESYVTRWPIRYPDEEPFHVPVVERMKLDGFTMLEEHYVRFPPNRKCRGDSNVAVMAVGYTDVAAYVWTRPEWANQHPNRIVTVLKTDYARRGWAQLAFLGAETGTHQAFAIYRRMRGFTPQVPIVGGKPGRTKPRPVGDINAMPADVAIRLSRLVSSFQQEQVRREAFWDSKTRDVQWCLRMLENESKKRRLKLIDRLTRKRDLFSELSVRDVVNIYMDVVDRECPREFRSISGYCKPSPFLCRVDVDLEFPTGKLPHLEEDITYDYNRGAWVGTPRVKPYLKGYGGIRITEPGGTWERGAIPYTGESKAGTLRA